MDLLFPRGDSERLEFKESALQIGFEELTAECTANISLLQPHDKLAVLMMAWKKIGDYLTQNQYMSNVGKVVKWVGRHTLELWFGRDWITCSSESKTTLIEYMMKVYPAAYISMYPYSWPYMFSIYRDPWMVDYLNTNFQRMNDPELSERLDAKDSDFIQQEGLPLIFLRIVNMFDFNMMKLVKHMCRRLLLAWHDTSSAAHSSLRSAVNAVEYIEFVRHMYLITIYETSGLKDLHYVLECVQRNMHCRAIECGHLDRAAHIIAEGLFEGKQTLVGFLIAFLSKVPERQFNNTFGNAVDKYKSFITEYILRKIHSRKSVGCAGLLPADGVYKNLLKMFIKRRESSEDLMKTTATVSERLFAGIHDLKALKYSYEQIKILTRVEWYTTKVTLLLGIINEELNNREECKYIEGQTADELIQKEQDLAIYYRDLSKLLSKTPVLEQESWLTTFSLHPCKEYLEAVTKCGSRNLRQIKKQAITLKVISEPKLPVKVPENGTVINPDTDKPSTPNEIEEEEKILIPIEGIYPCTTADFIALEVKKEHLSVTRKIVAGKSKLKPQLKKATKTITKPRLKSNSVEKKVVSRATTPIPKKPLPDCRDKDTAEVLYAASAGAGDNVSLHTAETIKYPEFAIINSVTDTEDVIRYTNYDGEVLAQYRELSRILSNIRLQHSNYDDLLALLIAPRYKRLTWATCWKNLRKRCRFLLTKDNRKRQLIEQCLADANERLTHLQIDYEKYKNKPQIDYGTIEDGYECFDTESGDDSDLRRKTVSGARGVRLKRPKKKRVSQDVEEDFSEGELPKKISPVTTYAQDQTKGFPATANSQDQTKSFPAVTTNSQDQIAIELQSHPDSNSKLKEPSNKATGETPPHRPKPEDHLRDTSNDSPPKAAVLAPAHPKLVKPEGIANPQKACSIEANPRIINVPRTPVADCIQIIPLPPSNQINSKLPGRHTPELSLKAVPSIEIIPIRTSSPIAAPHSRVQGSTSGAQILPTVKTQPIDVLPPIKTQPIDVQVASSIQLTPVVQSPQPTQAILIPQTKSSVQPLEVQTASSINGPPQATAENIRPQAVESPASISTPSNTQATAATVEAVPPAKAQSTDQEPCCVQASQTNKASSNTPSHSEHSERTPSTAGGRSSGQDSQNFIQLTSKARARPSAEDTQSPNQSTLPVKQDPREAVRLRAEDTANPNESTRPAKPDPRKAARSSAQSPKQSTPPAKQDPRAAVPSSAEDTANPKQDPRAAVRSSAEDTANSSQSTPPAKQDPREAVRSSAEDTANPKQDPRAAIRSRAEDTAKSNHSTPPAKQASKAEVLKSAQASSEIPESAQRSQEGPPRQRVASGEASSSAQVAAIIKTAGNQTVPTAPSQADTTSAPTAPSQADTTLAPTAPSQADTTSAPTAPSQTLDTTLAPSSIDNSPSETFKLHIPRVPLKTYSRHRPVPSEKVTKPLPISKPEGNPQKEESTSSLKADLTKKSNQSASEDNKCQIETTSSTSEASKAAQEIPLPPENANKEVPSDLPKEETVSESSKDKETSPKPQTKDKSKEMSHHWRSTPYPNMNHVPNAMDYTYSNLMEPHNLTQAPPRQAQSPMNAIMIGEADPWMPAAQAAYALPCQDQGTNPEWISIPNQCVAPHCPPVPPVNYRHNLVPDPCSNIPGNVDVHMIHLPEGTIPRSCNQPPDMMYLQSRQNRERQHQQQHQHQHQYLHQHQQHHDQMPSTSHSHRAALVNPHCHCAKSDGPLRSHDYRVDVSPGQPQHQEQPKMPTSSAQYVVYNQAVHQPLMRSLQQPDPRMLGVHFRGNEPQASASIVRPQERARPQQINEMQPSMNTTYAALPAPIVGPPPNPHFEIPPHVVAIAITTHNHVHRPEPSYSESTQQSSTIQEPENIPFIDLRENDANDESVGIEPPSFSPSITYTYIRPELNTVQIVKPSGTTRVNKMSVEMGQGIRRRIPKHRLDLLEPSGDNAFPNPRWRPFFSSVFKRKLIFVPTEDEVDTILSEYSLQRRNGRIPSFLNIRGLTEDNLGEDIVDESVIINLTNPDYTDREEFYDPEETDRARHINQSRAEPPGKEAGVTYHIGSRPPLHFFLGIPTPAYHISFVCPCKKRNLNMDSEKSILTVEPHIVYKMILFLREDDFVWQKFNLSREQSSKAHSNDDEDDDDDEDADGDRDRDRDDNEREEDADEDENDDVNMAEVPTQRHNETQIPSQRRPYPQSNPIPIRRPSDHTQPEKVIKIEILSDSEESQDHSDKRKTTATAQTQTPEQILPPSYPAEQMQQGEMRSYAEPQRRTEHSMGPRPQRPAMEDMEFHQAAQYNFAQLNHIRQRLNYEQQMYRDQEFTDHTAQPDEIITADVEILKDGCPTPDVQQPHAARQMKFNRTRKLVVRLERHPGLSGRSLPSTSCQSSRSNQTTSRRSAEDTESDSEISLRRSGRYALKVYGAASRAKAKKLAETLTNRRSMPSTSRQAQQQQLLDANRRRLYQAQSYTTEQTYIPSTSRSSTAVRPTRDYYETRRYMDDDESALDFCFGFSRRWTM